MTSHVPELVVDVLSMLAYVLVAGALTVGGTFAEYSSVQHLGTGEATLALWFAAIGAIMLYAGVYGIAYQKLLAQVVQRAA